MSNENVQQGELPQQEESEVLPEPAAPTKDEPGADLPSDGDDHHDADDELPDLDDSNEKDDKELGGDNLSDIDAEDDRDAQEKEGSARNSWGTNDTLEMGSEMSEAAERRRRSTGEEEEEDLIEVLKGPGSLDDFMKEWEEARDSDVDEEAIAATRTSSINILDLSLQTREEATPIAEYILQLLEEDLALHVQTTGIKFPEPLTKREIMRMKRGLKDTDSASSFDSNLSDILPGEPSRIRMTYEKGVSVYADMSLMHLSAEDGVDKEIQVNLHRAKKRRHGVRFSRYTQTLDMTYIPMETALLIFKQMYPQMDDYKVKEPPSRKASQERAIAIAEATDPNIDNKRKGPQIISLSNKKQLLQPLMDDYFKEERFWTGSRFLGEYKNKRFFKGRYDHPTGTKFESEFYDGHFETNNHFGLVSYPRGDTFEGEWRRGRYQSGSITFCDGLKFSGADWKYCEPPDRRFKVERYYGIKPAGMTLFSDQYPAPHVPPGMYDVGDGFYNSKTGEVRGYDGFLLRHATETEKHWIERNCRKVHESMEHIAPNFLLERIPGSYVETQKKIPLTKKRYH
ncbi:MORN repeat-containing protein 5 [Orchesella cincta]|uniref:MORN repeat-containing protein 5 n=1 Tax=Orchesella cincta TaxID=48709 RepID=A0A1D2MR71_ORCCI|nr:MORN repeat-containing protein 5 [Orchesella cincta]